MYAFHLCVADGASRGPIPQAAYVARLTNCRDRIRAQVGSRCHFCEIATHMTSSGGFGRTWHRALRVASAFAVLSVATHALAAQPVTRCADDRRVHDIRFVGSPLYSGTMLATSIATTAPTVFGALKHKLFRIGEQPCSDSLELQLDALRIAVLHRQAGWMQAGVAAKVTKRPDGLHILFDITPGAPFLLDSLEIAGLPAPPGRERPFDAPLRALLGQRFDRIRFDTTVTAVVTRLRNAGYARAIRPTLAIDVDTAHSRAHVALAFNTGAHTTVHAVGVTVRGIGTAAATIDTADVRRLTTLRPGVPYRASDVLNAQRDLYRADVFRLVLIDTVAPPATVAGADSLIDIRIEVAEARTRNARVGLGWATLECVRAQARMIDRRFLNVGTRLELTARASRIGVGAPADFAPRLCSSALRADTQFTVLNHYLGATVSSTRLFGSPLSPVTTIYTERRSEPYAYVREIGVGALMELTKQLGRYTSGGAGLQYENGRTKIDPAESCTRFGQCRKEDYDQSVFGRGVGIFSTSVSRERTNSSLDPSRGYRMRGEVRAGQTFARTDSSVRFYRASGEASTYARVLGGVIAGRVQVARVFAPGAPLIDGSPLIPQQERLFAGGQSTVRGFQQNLLGSLVYVVSDVKSTERDGVPVVEAQANTSYRPVPRGGTAMAVANIEYRRGFTWLAEQLQFASFVDVGNVWEGGSEPFRFKNLRATPGVGLRVVTALGPFRVDVGYQPYELRLGRALYVAKGTLGAGGSIQCASPGNSVSIDPSNPGDIFRCPETFRPARGTGVLSRLTFHFGLGQAF